MLRTLRTLRDYTCFLRRPKQQAGTSWHSTVLAASEEWVDETHFRFQPTLKGADATVLLAQEIVSKAREGPDQEILLRELTAKFSLPDGEALAATDRALGGVARAVSRNLGARPSSIDDPIAAASFDIAMLDEGVLDDIYPGWREWRPGPHSKPRNQEAEQDGAQNP